MKKIPVRFLSVLFLLLISVVSAHAYYPGDDLGYIDYVTVNGQEFEQFDERQVVFYPEDLEKNDGLVFIRGLLESEQKSIPVSDLVVEITLDGGETWTRAKGNSRWEYRFRPETGKAYDFSIRVVRNSGTLDDLKQQLLQLGKFKLRTAATLMSDGLSGQGFIVLGWLKSYLPERLLDPTTHDLKATFENLKVAGDRVTSGSVTVYTKTEIDTPVGTLVLNSLTFSPSGVSLDGSVTVSINGLNLDKLPIDALNLNPQGLSGDLVVADDNASYSIDIFKGTYGVTLVLNALTLHVDSSKRLHVELKALSGAVKFGSGYGNLEVPNIKLLADQTIGWGKAAVAQGKQFAAGLTAEASQAGENAANQVASAVAGVTLTIPGTEFKLADIGGAIDLAQKSVSLSGRFELPESLGGGSVGLPAEMPLVLSKQGISTSGRIQWVKGADVLPTLDLSGFPTTLNALALEIADNIPSGLIVGTVTLENFANLSLDVAADIDKTGLTSVRLATETATYSYELADFATLTLTQLALQYEDGDFSVEMDGSIIPTTEIVSSITGIGESLQFKGLKIAQDAITLANDLAGWHDLSGASAEIEGAILTLSQYGIGVEDNKFWVGLKGSGSLGGAGVTATARVFHDGTTELSGIDLDKLYLAFGDFSLRVDRSAVNADGLIDAAQGAISGLPAIVQEKFPQLFNEANELLVQLSGLSVDITNRQVTFGLVSLNPSAPLEFALGPVQMKLSALTFSPSGADIDGSISLAGLGLPLSDIPFNDLQLGKFGFAGEIDLVGLSGNLQVTLLEGDYGFGLGLTELSVDVDTQRPLVDIIQLAGFAGSLQFGSGFNNLEIPDLTLLADHSIHWGKNLAAGVADSAKQLILPGGLFSLGNLGGSVDLENKALSISGTLILPPSMNSASITIPADHPLTLSASSGLSTDGPIIFNPGDLPTISLEKIPSELTALSIDISHGNISGTLAGEMTFAQFGGLKIAANAMLDKTGLKEVEIGGAVNKNLDLQGFATLTLDKVTSGYKDNNFYVEIDGGIQATHTLFADYGKKVDLKGLRIFKSGIEFAQDMDGWNELKGGDVNINAIKLALEQYGLGIEGGKLWFGLKGSANYQDNNISLTARIFQDGTYKISDFGFDGLTLALGEFSLRTSAEAVAGMLSGEGFINVGFLMAYLPEEMKDPLTGELKVQFTNLGVDLDAHSITSGMVTVNFPRGLSVDLAAVQANLNSISFGFDGASVDGSISLATINGIAMPDALAGLGLDDIDLSPSGFKGTINWPATTAGVESTSNKGPSRRSESGGMVGGHGGGGAGKLLTIPVVTGDYGIALKLSRVALRLDTTKSSILEMIKLTDLDGSVKLGSAYGDTVQEVSNLRMLADGAITWGVETAEDFLNTAKDTATGAAQNVVKGAASIASSAATGFSFTIPGTSFKVNNLAGSLSLEDRSVALWGKINLPADLGGGSIGLSRENSLVLSMSGISTNGPVDIDPGSLTRFKLSGFSADVSAFSFGLSNNSVSGSIAADLKLNKFDNIPIAVTAAFDSGGIAEMTVAADRLQQAFDIGDFARIDLSKVEGGYDDGEFFVAIDADLTLENSAISDLDRSFSFTGLKIYKDALALAEASTGMQTIDGATINLNDAMLMSLTQYGFGVTDNRFWVALSGGVTFGGQDVTATAKVYQDGEFELDQLGGNLLIAVGNFTLRTSFNYSDGIITEATGGLNLGSFMSSIPADLKDPFGDLPVTIRNVEIDLSDPTAPKIKSGSISFVTAFPVVTDFFTAQINGIEVGAVDGAAYGKVLGGTITFHQTGSLPALEGISITNIGLSGSGFSGDLTWNGSQPQTAHIFEDANYGIDAELSSITIGFDSSKTTLSEIIKLKSITGSLAFGSGYGTSIAPAIGYDSVADNYTFAAGVTSALKIPGTSVKLKGVAGSFNFDSAKVSLGGQIVFPYESTEISFAVNELEFSSSGVAGSVALENPIDIQGLGFPTVLTQASLSFSGFSISSGSLGLDLTLEQFFGLQVAAALTVDNSGISAWSLGGETDASFTADAGFAELTVSDLGAGYDSTDGLFFSMNTDITMKADAVLSAMPDDMSLSGLQVYATKISVDAAEMSRSFNGTTVSLAGVDLTLNQLGIGYNQKFYLLAGGNINIADLCEAGAVVKLYDDLTFELNEIEIAFTNPAVEFSGYLAMYSNDPVYGTGFSAGLDVLIAGTLPLSGALQVGSIDNDTDSYVYWRVMMKTGATIPLSPIPMNIYGIGGGVAYHMRINATPGNVSFDPSADTLFGLTALLDLGSLDTGYTYFGKFSLTMEPTNYRVVLTGDSWFMEGKSASGTAHLAAVIELGASPAMLHVQAQAHLSKEASGFTLLGVDGGVDLLFSESDWHIYFGSVIQQLEVTALEFLTGSGYIQLDSSGIAMGVKYVFDLEGSAWIFYGRLYGGAQIDLAAGIKPFYIDARGRLWIGLEAGVKARGKKFEIMSAYAELGAHFKASETAGVFVGIHGEMSYSFLAGLVSGTWEVTFTMPEDAPAGAGDSSIEDIPLLTYAEPEDGAEGVGRLDSISIHTNMPLMRPFRYDDGNKYILCIKDPDHPDNCVDFSDVRAAMAKALRLRSASGLLEVYGGLQGGMGMNFTPVMDLGRHREFTYKTTLQLRHWNGTIHDGSIGSPVKEEIVHNGFTTADEELSFRERVYAVYPTRSTTPIYKGTSIYLITKAVFDGYIWNWALQSEALRFEVVNAAKEPVPGEVTGKVMVTDGQEGSRRYLLNFIPEQPLEPVRMVENEAGIKRPALVLDDGSFWNPFLDIPPGRHLEGESEEESGSSGLQVTGLSAATMAPTRTVEGAVGVGTPASRYQSSVGKEIVVAGAKRTVTTPVLGGQGHSFDDVVAPGKQPFSEDDIEEYRWYWDGEYQIRIVDNSGKKKFSSKFNLTLPEEGSDAVAYADSQDVIELGINNPHFNINFTLDQDAYKADVNRGYRSVVQVGIDALWPLFRNSTYADAGETCQYRSPRDIEGLGALLAGVPPDNWEFFSSIHPSVERAIRRFAMETCAPLAAKLAEVDQRFDEYKQAAFERNPSTEFRSLEFRFSTSAPINWNEIEAVINFEPHANGNVKLGGVTIDYGATTRNEFDRGDYIVRSQSGSLNHILELKDKVDAYFDGKMFLQIYGAHQTWGHGISLVKTGYASFFTRSLQEGVTDLDPYSGEYSLQRGDYIGGTGWINALTPTSFFGQ